MNILIIRNDRIGDLISSTLIINHLKNIFKKKIKKIDLICSRSGYLYASQIKHELRNIYINGRKISFLNDISLLKIIRNNNYDLCISLSPNYKSFFLNLFSKSKIKATIRITNKKGGASKPTNFLSNFFDTFINIKNNKNYHSLTWEFFYKKLCINIFEFIFKKKLLIKNKFKAFYVKPKIYASFNKKVNNFYIFHVDDKWNRKLINEKKLSNVILKLSKKYKILLTTNYFKTDFNKKLFHFLDFENKKEISLIKTKKSKNLFLLNCGENENSFKYFSKLSYIVSKCKCLIQIHGGLGHYAGSFNRNVINIIIKKENLQKLYRIHTKGLYADINIKKSKNFIKSLDLILKKII